MTARGKNVKLQTLAMEVFIIAFNYYILLEKADISFVLSRVRYLFMTDNMSVTREPSTSPTFLCPKRSRPRTLQTPSRIRITSKHGGLST